MPSNAAAARDALTGLPGRSVFEADFAARIGRKSKQPAVISLAVVDIDLFGAINEVHGRETGDGVLCDLVAALTACLAGEEALYRFGGDALAVMLPGVEKEQAFLRMEAFRSGYAGERTLASGQVVPVSISMGLAAYSDDGVKAQDVVHKANEALYRAKVGGRDRICLAREEKMVTKTSHYMQGQLLGLRRLAEREKIGEALLLREALNDLLRKYNA
ncbi:MAG: GGDEF domain-containing protein [Candidatus Hydrogenedentes bacterium]|nr:GGDEF domain-containing protein [Candidatus Hydrogenedentota bacterium]